MRCDLPPILGDKTGKYEDTGVPGNIYETFLDMTEMLLHCCSALRGRHMTHEPATVGKHLAVLREQAQLKQNELAKKLKWSAAVLSRVENGERLLSDEELDIILRGIGTPGAMKLKQVLARRWERLPVPALGDSDADLIWEAEQVAVHIHALAEQPDVKQFFERRLVRYGEELRAAAECILDKCYRVAFVGTIAVGKSTSICRIEGLELPSTKGMPSAVLRPAAGASQFVTCMFGRDLDTA
jgi:transcriptional regulator with XRE-family HTH domain